MIDRTPGPSSRRTGPTVPGARRGRRRFGRIFHAALLLASLCLVAATSPARAEDGAERASLEVMSALLDGDLGRARRLADELARAHPDFRAARTLRADLGAIALGVDPATIAVPAAGEFSVDDFRAEARQRWKHHRSAQAAAPGSRLPAALLQMPDSARHAIVAEMSTSRLYVFANEGGRPRLVEDWYMGIGRAGYLKTAEGDLRTPLGVYSVTRWIDGSELPDLYGTGAFPVDYPNAWDRLNERTGHGIWIHGVPSGEYSRPPLSSEGCMTVGNEQIERLRAWVDVGRTPVVAVERVRWLSDAQWQGLRGDLLGELERWRAAWASGDPSYYATYAADFRNEGHESLRSWLRSRRQFEARGQDVAIDLSDVALLRYGGEEDDLWKASFVQHYRSASLDSRVRKDQLWRRTPQGFEIVFEDISDS